ncbi:MAG: 2-O-methyltransferase NoeI [Candidatus Parcubacteria bacterium]|jgi:FkbM family methyltransferase
MKFIKSVIEYVFNIIYPILKPEIVQRLLRNIGFKFPYYRFAEKLGYRGIVDFYVNKQLLRMRSYNSPIEIFIFWFGIYGYWEAVQLRLWSKLVLEADIILDIGANNGVYSLIASTNTRAKVFAFEPAPDVLDMLRVNVELNYPNKIEVMPVLVGDVVGESTLYIPKEGWTDIASLDKEFAKSAYGDSPSLREITCSMTTIDAVLEKSDRRPEQTVLCKIDVEQAEMLVLAGMKNTLATKNVQFVIELLTEENFNNVCTLIPANYSIYAINEVKKSVTLVTKFNSEATNYLFTENNHIVF